MSISIRTVSLVVFCLGISWACHVARVTSANQEEPRWAVIHPKIGGDQVYFLAGPAQSTQNFLTSSQLNEARAICSSIHKSGGDLQSSPAAGLSFLSPITSGGQIILQGPNYSSPSKRQSHNTTPFTIFMKPSSSLAGPNDDVIRPDYVQALDYEIEMGVVIGKEIRQPIRGLTESTVLDFIVGMVLAQDFTARDLQFIDETRSKSFRTFNPIGPYLYLLSPNKTEAWQQLNNIRMRLWVNNVLKQDAMTREMIIKLPETLSRLSTMMNLYPGDIIMTGSPSGSNIDSLFLFGGEPISQRFALLLFGGEMSKVLLRTIWQNGWLKPGDHIQAHAGDSSNIQLGVMSNRIIGASGTTLVQELSTSSNPIDFKEMLPGILILQFFFNLGAAVMFGLLCFCRRSRCRSRSVINQKKDE